MLGAALAMAASLLWGTSDFLGGTQSRRTTVWAVALVSQVTAAAVAGVVLAVVTPRAPSTAELAAPVVAGVAITLSALGEYKAMTLAPLSVVAPIFAGAAVVPVVWGLARGERPGAVAFLGMALAILGIVLITRLERKAPESARRASGAGVLLAMFAALMIGVVLIAYDYGGAVDPYWTVAVARVAALLTLALVWACVRPKAQLRAGSVLAAMLIGVFLVTANTLYTAATTMGMLSVVAVLGWLSPAVTVFWAQALLHERLRPVQWLAAALVLAGVVCLALG
jgi:drug/metabolite transporter (DMT)-like permease